jgi:hypothetical protein
MKKYVVTLFPPVDFSSGTRTEMRDAFENANYQLRYAVESFAARHPGQVGILGSEPSPGITIETTRALARELAAVPGLRVEEWQAPQAPKIVTPARKPSTKGPSF